MSEVHSAPTVAISNIFEMNNSLTANNRIEYIDTLRVLACFMVVLVHSPIPHPNQSENISYGLISYLCSPCIGLFLMVSGALLLPQKNDTKTFLKRRLNRIISPLIFWSAIYLFIEIILGKIDIYQAFISFIKLPFGCVQGFAHGWYLYAIIGIYLFIPIFNSWINNRQTNKQTTQYFLLLWLIVMCYPYFKAIVGYTNHLTLYNFAGYFGYIVLGYFLHNYPISIKSFKSFIILTSFTLILSGIFPAIIFISDIKGYDTYNQIVYNYSSISTVVMCIFIFVSIQNFNLKNTVYNTTMSNISNLSFGIYLVNFAFIRYLFFPYFIENPLDNTLFEILITTFGSFSLAYIVSLLISKLPISKYIIG